MPRLTHLDAHRLDEILRGPIEAAPLPPLGAQSVDGPLAAVLRSDACEELALPAARRAALWLLAGDLEASHEISQTLGTPLGSFWHGVMHRREGDYSNAKYWFRRAGSLSFYPSLAAAVREDPRAEGVLRRDHWDAEHFVDLCCRAVRKDGDLEQACREAQWIEWQVAWLG
jgi:hypothetical protein